MYKWLIVFFSASILLLVSSSRAQLERTGSLPEPIDSSRIVDLGGGVIVTGDGQTMTGVDSGVVSASGLDLSGTVIVLLSGEISSGTIDSGTIIEPISDPISHLMLSEVYYDGTDEWIEITNIGDGNFQGNFTLVGVKSTPLLMTNISLLSGESKIFGDNLSQVSGNRFIGKTGLALNILDTAAINIQILISGQVEDSFLVDQYWVNLYNDKKTSFEKVGGIPTRVQTSRVVNAQSGTTINPGMYFGTGKFTNVTFPPSLSGTNSGLPISCDSVDQRDLIKINEIFPGNEKYPPYVELAIHSDMSINSLSISGDRLSTGLEFSFGSLGTTLEKNSYLLISSTGFWQGEGINSVRNHDFSLLSTGNYLLITIGSGQSRRVMDIVLMSGNMIGKSSYFGSTSNQCARIMDVLDDFSPGFDQKFLKYFSGTTTTKIEYITITTGSQQGTGSCLLSGQDGLFSGENQVVMTGFKPENYTIRITHVDYDPEGSDTNNEKVTLLATNLSGDTTPLDLSNVFRLRVNGTNKTLPRILPMNTPMTFTKTFGFPNSTDNGQSVVIQLTYGEYIFDTYTYNPNIPVVSKEIITGDIQTSGTLFDLSGIKFSITYVLPNPKGKDVTEEIGLVIYPTPTLPIAWRGSSQIVSSLRSGEGVGGEVTREQLDLSQGFSLRIGKSKKKINEIVYIGQENILSGSLGLVNKAACVSLFYQENELTKFCYGTPKEGEKIYFSDSGLQETPQENLDILNLLQLKRIANTLCIRYKDESFLCKRIPASKAELKVTQEQKLYKGFASIVKQYIINNRKSLYYDTSLKEYFDRVTLDKKLIAQGIAHVDIYGQSVLVTDVKKQLQIIQTTSPGIIALFDGAEALSIP
ncbi:MAG: hypothetical protein NT085_04345 [candidate division SR1 bacterium]|nr:hypothetical protein [candidate division SR1 bacterium]